MIFKKKPQVVAAVDLGSNSFHMVVAREQEGQLNIIDTIKEMVRLGSGVTDNHDIDEITTIRAVACLQRFGQRLSNMHPNYVRVVGTNALRRAHRGTKFIDAAEAALGHPIEVISGIEEARLIYNGVSHSLPTHDSKNLVIDIGGGSTEIVIGQGYTPKMLESLYMGSLSISSRFFPDGEISKKRFVKALLFAHRELEPIATNYQKHGWDQAVGSSGSVRAVFEYADKLGLSNLRVSLNTLYKILDDLIEIGHTDQIDGINMARQRGPVFPGGLVILIAVFEALEIKQLQYSDYALREGILYELVGSYKKRDIHAKTVANICKRYHVDTQHAGRVEASCDYLYNQVAKTWDIDSPHLQNILSWAAQLHELGIAISHSRHQLHGAYLMEHANLPGFNRQDQSEVAAVIRLHRRKLRLEYLSMFKPRRQAQLLHLALILRLACILRRNRIDQTTPDIRLAAKEQELVISFSQQWLDEHPLTQADIEDEAEYWNSIDYNLIFK